MRNRITATLSTSAKNFERYSSGSTSPLKLRDSTTITSASVSHSTRRGITNAEGIGVTPVTTGKGTLLLSSRLIALRTNLSIAGNFRIFPYRSRIH